jgi:hypothetical protein
LSKQAVVAGLIGLVVVGVVVSSSVYFAHQQRLHLSGQILKVRSQQLEPGASFAIADFRVINPSKHQFKVSSVSVVLTDPSGKDVEGITVSEVDAQRLFQYYPVLGQKFNQTLLTREKIEGGQTIDRMIAVRFPVDDQWVQARKGLKIIIEEVDGLKAVIQ